MKYVAEISGEHQGNFGRASQLVMHAASSGATHVKFQCFTPEQMVGDPEYRMPGGLWKGVRLLDLYRDTHTPRDWFPDLFQLCRDEGVVPMASPFHPNDVSFLEKLGCEVYKISSFETCFPSLLDAVLQTGKEVYISTGTSNYWEMCRLWKMFGRRAVYLKCTSAYPASPHNANLRTLSAWQSWDHRVGISDHTRGIGVAIAAAVLGAEVIEKHFTISRADGGPDAEFSLEPMEFGQMVAECETAIASIGTVSYGPTEGVGLRRSLWWARDLPAGHVVEPGDVMIRRPALGRSPWDASSLFGTELMDDVKANTPCR